jgi:hypothetical protein
VHSAPAPSQNDTIKIIADFLLRREALCYFSKVYRFGFMKYFTILLLSMMVHAVHAQGIFRVSLGKTKIKTDSINFTIAELIDGRHDTKAIGVIQRRITNRKALAMLDKPGLTEIEGLLKRSGLLDEKGLSIRVSRFNISEITRKWEEVSKAELSLDLFIKHENQYSYIASTYATVELDGTDVTPYHEDNIVACVTKALAQLSSLDKNIREKKPFTKDQLENPNLTFWNIQNMPIVNTKKYKDGYYASFEEFVNNTPSIDIDCKIKIGEVHRLTCGAREEKINSIYGYAKDNKVYILYYQNFYLLEKKDVDFYFLGPTERSTRRLNDYNKSILLPPSMGGMAMHSKIYSIDLRSGGIENVTGL